MGDGIGTPKTPLVLTTQRLALRRMHAGDRQALCRVLQDPEVMYAYGHAFSHEEVDNWLQNQLRRYEEYGFGLWLVEDKDTGQAIGQCGITMQRWGARMVPEVGYLFEKAYWHKGYATEAATACRDYAFTVLDMPVIHAIIRRGNTASEAVARRLGMRPCGFLVKHYYGMNMPHTVYCVERP